MNGFPDLSSVPGLRYGRTMCHRPTTIGAILLLTVPGCQGDAKNLPLVAPTPGTFDPIPDGDSGPGTHPPDSGPPPDSGAPVPQWDEGPPPVVVLFVGDGMGAEHVRGAGLVGYGASGTLFMETAPHQGWIQTASLSGYTDSAASATAMATGTKTYNGRLGIDAHGHEIEGLVDIARLRGLSVGVVTTDTLTGATPSAFLTHVSSRYDTDAVAAALAADLPEVMLGGGSSYLLDPLAESAAVVVQTAEELTAAPVELARPLVGLFSATELPMIVDMPEEDLTPRLPILVSTALDHLLTDPDGTFLVVEGARIDHASHANRTDAVFSEVLELDQAVRQTIERLSGLEDRAVTVLVTADHECGGLTITDPTLGAESGLPGVSWIWSDHTNRDVPLYGWGDAATPLAGNRQHNNQIWATLDGALRSRAAVEPTLPRLPDGMLDDLGAAVTTQTADTDFGSGFNQLDALRVTTDDRGIWVGIDGVFDERANGVIVWLDLDYGAATGVGAGMDLTDVDGFLDRLIGAPTITTELPGLGFDAAIAQVGASYARTTATRDTAGARQFQPPSGSPTDLAWLYSAVNYDDGNVADGTPAPDAGATGASIHGMEALLPFSELWPEGIPEAGASMAVMVTLSSVTGSSFSNQALPPQDVRGPEDSVVVTRVVSFEVAADGQLRSPPIVIP